jgi:GNAT superfamily N-acetyltransferase
VRRATLADVEVILGHRRSMFADMGFANEGELDAMVVAARPVVADGLRDGSYQAWLAEVDGRVVAGGGVAIVGFQPTPFEPTARRAWILNMYTEPAFRRQGLARQVLESIIEWCREQSFRSVFLHASDAGFPLYQSEGFKPTTEMRLLLE